MYKYQNIHIKKTEGVVFWIKLEYITIQSIYLKYFYDTTKNVLKLVINLKEKKQKYETRKNSYFFIVGENLLC